VTEMSGEQVRTEQEYAVAADWAETGMVAAGSMTALRGPAAADRGREMVHRAAGVGRRWIRRRVRVNGRGCARCGWRRTLIPHWTGWHKPRTAG